MYSNIQSKSRYDSFGLVWLIAGCLMTQPLATDLYLPSLPHIAIDLQAVPALVQQTLSLFMLGFASAQLASGPLSDRFGRRPILILGLVVYVLASVACAFSTSLTALLIGRFIQAIGCCTVVVVARTIIHETYSPAEGVLVFVRVSSIYALAPILGPILGAYLQVTIGWRAAFFVFSLFGSLLVSISYFYLKETNHCKHLPTFSLHTFFGNYFLLIRNPVFWSYTLPGALSFSSIFVFLSGSAFLLINVFGIPTQWVGFFFAASAVGYWLGTMVCRRFLRRYGIKQTFRAGAMLACLACLVFPSFAITGFANWMTLLLGQFLVMFAHGINFPCAQSGVITPFPKNAGAAAALMGALTMLLAFGVGTLVSITYDGTPYPISVILVSLGFMLVISQRFLWSSFIRAHEAGSVH